MAYSNAEVKNWWDTNITSGSKKYSDTELADLMDQHGVSADQLAASIGEDAAVVNQRYNAVRQPVGPQPITPAPPAPAAALRDKIASGQITTSPTPAVTPPPNPPAAPTYDGYTVATSVPSIKTAGVTKAGVTGYTPGEFTADGYTAETYDAGGYDAATRGSDTYTATTGNVNKWNVDPSQLVENRVTGLIASESPMMQLAETKAKQRMNEKGLLSSSMAIGEGQRAVIETATPIASQDAATLARSGEFNASQGNLMEQFNVGQKNTSLQFNAQEANKARTDNQSAMNRASEFLAQAENAAKADNANAKNNAAAFTAQAKNEAQALTVKAKNDEAAFRAQAENAATAAEAAAANEAALESARVYNAAQAAYVAAVNRERELGAQGGRDTARDTAKFNADAALQGVDAATRKEIQTLADDAQNRSATSAAANDLYITTVGAIDTIMNNPDLDPAAKQAAVNTQRDNLRTGLDFLSATSGIQGLKDLINFSSLGA